MPEIDDIPVPQPGRDARAIPDLFLGFLRRDLASFFDHIHLKHDDFPIDPASGPQFRLIEHEDGVSISLFGARHRLEAIEGRRLGPIDLQMVRSIGAVLSLRYQHLFQSNHSTRLELYRGGSEDHYVAAFVEPWCYTASAVGASRIASTIQTLRTAALSTYENRRVSTGALLLGRDVEPDRPVASDSLGYGVELTTLKSLHRLCDGKRTLFLVDQLGRLVDVIDVARWAESVPASADRLVPCPRDYAGHARATLKGGSHCVVLSPNQEIKLFASGSQQFAFTHGRWRILDPKTKYETWAATIDNPQLARVLFQTALDLAEARQGGMFVVIDEPEAAVGRLLSPLDLLADVPHVAPPVAFNPGDPLAKRALHYLARGRSVVDLDSSVLEALAALDGAIATDRSGRLLAFGAILRHDASNHYGPAVEGARTTAAIIASRFGPVLKVSEDGIVSCFLGGSKVWDL